MGDIVKKATTVSYKGLQIIRNFEGLRLKAYRDVVGVPTIGYGTTHYPYGKQVKMGDVITVERAEELLQFEANAKAYAINEALKNIWLNTNQMDACVSLAYNIGVGAFLGSTVLRRIKVNQFDPKITDAFKMWKYGTKNGVKIIIPALVTRRAQEAALYFS